MFDKPFLVFAAPINTRSGYGAHSRDIATALLKSGKYEVAFISTPWGNTPIGALDDKIESHREIMRRIIPPGVQLPKQPDVWVQNTVASEFQKVGKFNIGITAGIETTLCSPEWLIGCNNMDLVITTSQHSKDTFLRTAYTEQLPQGNRELKLLKPVEVLFEGIDTEIYKKVEDVSLEGIDEIPENFNFLFVGHWLNGKLGEDRKNVGLLIQTFIRTFASSPLQRQISNSPRVGLVLKTSGATFCTMDRDEMVKKITNIRQKVANEFHIKLADQPNIYLVHGDLTDEQMNVLYNHKKIKAHVTFTKGEGFGRPLLEASVSGKPIIAPAWSGYMDFLDADNSYLLPGKLTQVHHSAIRENGIVQGAQWFSVNDAAAMKVLKEVVDDYDNAIIKGKKQAYKARTNFTLEKMKDELVSIFEKYNNQPVQKAFEMPKVGFPKLKKVGETTEQPMAKPSFPKLKRVEEIKEK